MELEMRDFLLNVRLEILIGLHLLLLMLNKNVKLEI
nr:MAG TPA: hypothetical protein [Bacteriophage sp.]